MAIQRQDLLIYGATGYTGRLACAYAESIGVNFAIAGRSEEKLKQISELLQVPYYALQVDDANLIQAALRDCRVLLNCAGPFLHTAEPLISACMSAKVHYLDISAELDSYRFAERCDDEAQRAGVMLLPGCGGSVAMLGCLAGHALNATNRPVLRMDIALHVSGPMSRGSAVSAAENITGECFERRQGKLVAVRDASPSQFDFQDGRGDVACIPVTLPDLITLGRSTGISNIRTYVNISGDAFPTGDLRKLADGPTAEQRKANPCHAVAIIESDENEVGTSVLHTVNGYSFTAIASVEATRRVLLGNVRPGFQTPVEVFGSSFVTSIEGSKVLDGKIKRV